MNFELRWKDYPEIFDDDEQAAKCFLKCEGEISDDKICRDAPVLEIDGEAQNRRDAPLNFSRHTLISGDNYPCLKLFLENSVDLIYIDPPYNTGKDFTYRDNFCDGGDRHSAWLSFMERRLKIARKILVQSGCIFIAIDQGELYVLKLLCDQIFGENNFVNDFMWLHGKGKKDKWSRTLQQHTLCYAKDKKFLGSFSDFEETDWAKTNADGDERGNWFSASISFSEERSNPKNKNFYEIKSPSGKIWRRQWLIEKSVMQKLLAENKIYFGSAPEFSGVPRKKVFNGEKTEVIPRNIIDCVESTRAAQNHLDQLLGEKRIFDNPKPVDLIEHLIFITQMKKDAVILDFFAGSGTTFESVCKLNAADNGNRRCILIQKPEKNQENSDLCPEMSKMSIDQICKKRCEKVCQIYNQEMDFFTLATNQEGKKIDGS